MAVQRVREPAGDEEGADEEEEAEPDGERGEAGVDGLEGEGDVPDEVLLVHRLEAREADLHSVTSVLGEERGR